jgi:GxxExxY protein
MNENELSKIIVNASFEIHSEIGSGLFESVYEEILCYELNDKGLFIERQKPIPIYWNGIKMEKAFVADIIVDDAVIIEIKSIEKLGNIHFKQLLNYLKLTEMKLGLLINFNEEYLKNGIKRIVNNI